MIGEQRRARDGVGFEARFWYMISFGSFVDLIWGTTMHDGWVTSPGLTSQKRSGIMYEGREMGTKSLSYWFGLDRRMVTYCTLTSILDRRKLRGVYGN